MPKNQTGWDSYRWYNFEYNNQRLLDWRNKNSDKKLVIVVGSSIAKYSVLTPVIEDLIQIRGYKNIEVRNFMHAAMTPVDLYLYTKRLKKLKPDLIVYPINPADLDLERYSEPWQHSIDYDDESAYDFINIRHPGKLLYPGEFADEFVLKNGLHVYLQRKLYSAFYSLRMREQWWDPVLYNLKASRGFVKSYLNYQGILINEGLWKEGRSISCLSFPVDALKNEKGGYFRFEVPPGIVGDDFQMNFYSVPITHKNSAFDKYLWDLKSDPVFKNAKDFKKLLNHSFSSRLPNCNPQKKKLIKKVKIRAAGWQKVQLLDSIKNNNNILVRLSHVELLSGKRIATKNKTVIGKGIRLPAYFARNRNALVLNDLYVRRPDWDSKRLFLMGDKKARLDFYERNEPNDWRKKHAVWQLNNLRIGKYYSNWYDFNAEEMIQARYIKKITNAWKQQSKILIVNNPENPATLDVYEAQENSKQLANWYLQYQMYLKRICPKPRCFYFDEHRRMSQKYFLDAHHLTYEGMLLMAPIYSDMIVKALVSENKP